MKKLFPFIYTVFILMAAFLISCQSQSYPDGYEILEKSRHAHDPEDQWKNAYLDLHIQEPRLSNPARYSKIKMNNQDNTFELIRNRFGKLAKYSIDKEGKSSVLLDGVLITDTAMIKKYRQSPASSFNYQNFYQMMYGLPMSLNEERIEKIESVSTVDFNEKKCFGIKLILKEALFSKNWIVYISQSNYLIQGIELVFPEDSSKGERLYFDQTISVEGISIPRMRHWHELKDDTYLGSDIIII